MFSWCGREAVVLMCQGLSGITEEAITIADNLRGVVCVYNTCLLRNYSVLVCEWTVTAFSIREVFQEPIA